MIVLEGVHALYNDSLFHSITPKMHFLCPPTEFNSPALFAAMTCGAEDTYYAIYFTSHLSNEKKISNEAQEKDYVCEDERH